MPTDSCFSSVLCVTSGAGSEASAVQHIAHSTDEETSGFYAFPLRIQDSSAAGCRGCVVVNRDYRESSTVSRFVQITRLVLSKFVYYCSTASVFVGATLRRNLYAP